MAQTISLSEIEPPVTSQQIQKVEQSIEHELPIQYKAFLLKNNGGRPKPAYFNIRWSDEQPVKGWNRDFIHFFLSINDSGSSDFLEYYETFKGRIPNDTVSIAYDQGGNQILLGIGSQNYGKVFLWMHSYEADEEEDVDYSNVGFVANSFDEFTDSLYEAN